MPIHLAIFASGSGTNAENIIRYFNSDKEIKISRIFTNNPSAGVINRAKRLNIPCTVFNRSDFYEEEKILELLAKESIDFIVLAGFLWLVPLPLIVSFKGRIINIHPALLPSFGGKGFYGEKVHRAVIASGLPISGITIHHVNEHFDEGEIVFQAACHVSQSDDEVTLAAKIHDLEHAYFPPVLEKIIHLYLAKNPAASPE